MPNRRKGYLYQGIVLLWIILFSCQSSNLPADKQIVADPGQLHKLEAEDIKALLELAQKNAGRIDDTIRLNFVKIVDNFYKAREYEPAWSRKDKWEPLADSLFQFIVHAELAGLFPNDYHFKYLQSLKYTLDRDSLKRMNAALWSRADLMLTDGFMHLIKDLKLGRLQPDSISLNKDSALSENFFQVHINELFDKKQITTLCSSLEPRHRGYWELKKGIKHFLDSMDRRNYTYVSYPFKKGDVKDSVFFIKLLQKRLMESGVLEFSDRLPDSASLKAAIVKIQKWKGLKTDGKVTAGLIRSLNINDEERFKRIAITLDRYKQLPETMPLNYIWVNLPAYYLQVMDHDTVALESRIICGKPDTRTPLLNSRISEMITYPTWTVPTSIIVKSYLPKLKHNPNYISRIGLKLVNRKGETVNPGTINWGKYSKGIPFKVVQNSGDKNALGIFKFNFNNPYAVYLHDTNQRYLFKNSYRALSHGCVRVQEWQKLAFYIAKNDSINSNLRDSLKYNSDSIRNWISHKERHKIDVIFEIPIFVRYFSCEGKKGKIQFYDDIYGEDKILREKYFSNK